MAREIVLIGAGGHAWSLLDCFPSGGPLVVAGYVALEPSRLSGEGIEYLGGDDAAAELYARGLRFAVIAAVGASKNDRQRMVFDTWHDAGFQFAEVLHRTAVVSPRTRRGEGFQCLSGAIVNAGVAFGDDVIVNTGAIVEHDCQIGSHVHIAPGATLCGGVSIGEGSLVGAGAVVIPGLSVGAHSVVGAGSVVTRAVPNGTRVAGAPARTIARAFGDELQRDC